VSHEEAAANPDETYKVGTMKEHPLQSLIDAADGLLFPSETDAPFGTLFYPNTTPESIGEVLERAGAMPMQVVHFFERVTTPEPWHNAEEQETRRRWSELQEATEKTLTEPRAYLVGKGTRLVYIIGGVEGGCGGLQTYVVET